MKLEGLKTSESVTEGHPDKVCDFIADSILDEVLTADKNGRVACEVCASTGLIVVLGEFTTHTYVDIAQVARRAVDQVGYNDPLIGFDAKTCAVLNCINEQSPDISMGVTRALEARDGSRDEADIVGAGDQGMIFGYATDETSSFMPMPIALAHSITKTLADKRKSNQMPFLRPDGKAEVTVEYQGGVPKSVKSVVVSAQHSPEISADKLREAIIDGVVKKAIDNKLLKNTKYYVNPTGRFVIGGPAGDTGVTGRKLIVDSYGGAIPHGGGAMSGKDASKVDRSAAYYTRYVAKNVVAAGLAKRVMICVSYAIGVARPVALEVDSFGTGDDELILKAVESVFDFRPYSIINSLGLLAPIYRRTTNYGHFGKADLPWEVTDKVAELKTFARK